MYVFIAHQTRFFSINYFLLLLLDILGERRPSQYIRIEQSNEH